MEIFAELGHQVTAPRLVTREMIERLLKPAFYDELPKRYVRRFEQMDRIGVVMLTPHPFPSSLERLAEFYGVPLEIEVDKTLRAAVRDPGPDQEQPVDITVDRALSRRDAVIDSYRKHVNQTTAMLADLNGAEVETWAEGAYVYDQDERRYLDCGGYGVMLAWPRPPGRPRRGQGSGRPAALRDPVPPQRDGRRGGGGRSARAAPGGPRAHRDPERALTRSSWR